MAQVQVEDLHYLILNYLQAGPCQAAAQVLEQEAIRHQLLPRRTDIYGVQHVLSLAELQQRYSYVAPSALVQLLQQLLSYRQEAAGSAIFPGSSSLLDPDAVDPAGTAEPHPEAHVGVTRNSLSLAMPSFVSAALPPSLCSPMQSPSALQLTGTHLPTSDNAQGAVLPNGIASLLGTPSLPASVPATLPHAMPGAGYVHLPEATQLLRLPLHTASTDASAGPPLMSPQHLQGHSQLHAPVSWQHPHAASQQNPQAAFQPHPSVDDLWDTGQPAPGFALQGFPSQATSASKDSGENFRARTAGPRERGYSPTARTASPGIAEHPQGTLHRAGSEGADTQQEAQPALCSLSGASEPQHQGAHTLWRSVRDSAVAAPMQQELQRLSGHASPSLTQTGPLSSHTSPGMMGSIVNMSASQLDSQSQNGRISPAVTIGQHSLLNCSAPTVGTSTPMVGMAIPLDSRSQPGRISPSDNQGLPLNSPTGPGAFRPPLVNAVPQPSMQSPQGRTSPALGQLAVTSPSGLQSQHGRISPGLGQRVLTSPAAPGASQTSLVGPFPQLPRQPPRAMRTVPRLLERQLGLRHSSAPALLPGEELASGLKHVKTSRGHRAAVYCIAFARGGSLVVTGSDDRLVKLWSTETGLLRQTCRGHDGEVTDLAVSLDDSTVASSCTDWTIRCWSLKEGQLGYPVSVLVGHEGPVTFVDFSRVHPSALLSSSYDGTCRIWDATRPGLAPKVLPVSPAFGPMHGVTRHGGGREASTSPVPGQSQAAASGHGNRSQPETPFTGAAVFGQGMDAPEPSQSEADNIEPSESSLLVCSFSPDSTFIAAGCSDSHVYIWHWDIQIGTRSRSPGKPLVHSDHTLSADVEHADAERDREKQQWTQPQEMCRLPGHTGPVMMLQFSHDGLSIATGSKDGSVQVWRQPMRGGKRLQTWVRALDLPCAYAEESEVFKQARRRRRPLDPPAINQIAWSTLDTQVLAAVSDHTIRVWSADTGQLQRKLMKAGPPDSGHSASVHILEAHPSHPSLMLSASYDGLIIVWDIVSGQKITGFSTKATKPDGTSWVDPIQVADGHWAPDGQGIAVSDVAGQWHLFQTVFDKDQAAGALMPTACYDQFFSSDYDRLRRDTNHYVVDDRTQLPPHLRSQEDRLVDYLEEPYPELYQNAFLAGRLSALDATAIAAAQGRNLSGAPGLPSGLMQYPPYIAAASWQAQELQGDEAAVARAVQEAHARAQAAELTLALPAGPAGPQPRSAAQHLPRASQGSRGRSRVSQGRPTTPQQATSASQPSRPSSAAGRATNPGPSRSSTPRPAPRLPSEDDMHTSAGSSDEELMLESEWEDGPGSSRPERNSQRSQRASQRALLRAHEDTNEREARRLLRGLRQHEPGRGRNRQSSRKRPRTPAVHDSDNMPGLSSDGSDQEGGDMDGEGQRQHKRTRFGDEAAREHRPHRASASRPMGSRPAEAFQWLQEGFLAEGAWLPQLGDDVVYVAEGHRRLLQKLGSDTARPWESVSGDEEGHSAPRQILKPAEPANVVGVDYFIANEQQTWMRLKLALDDESSPLHGKEFTVDLPSPETDFGDFVILRSRWDAAMQQHWRVGNMCQVPYTEDGRSWSMGTGRIVADRAAESPTSLEAEEANPWVSDHLWERFTIDWQADDLDTAEEQGHHSHWELFPPGTDICQAANEAPCLDDAITEMVAQKVEGYMHLERFTAYAELPDPAERWVAAGLGGERMYYNSIIPLPLSLEHILVRLQKRFYRQPAALLQDLDTFESNATLFNGPDDALTKEAGTVALWIRRTLDKAISSSHGNHQPRSQHRSRIKPSSSQDHGPDHADARPGLHELRSPPRNSSQHGSLRTSLRSRFPDPHLDSASTAGLPTQHRPGGMRRITVRGMGVEPKSPKAQEAAAIEAGPSCSSPVASLPSPPCTSVRHGTHAQRLAQMPDEDGALSQPSPDDQEPVMPSTRNTKRLSAHDHRLDHMADADDMLSHAGDKAAVTRITRNSNRASTLHDRADGTPDANGMLSQAGASEKPSARRTTRSSVRLSSHVDCTEDTADAMPDGEGVSSQECPRDQASVSRSTRNSMQLRHHAALAKDPRGAASDVHGTPEQPDVPGSAHTTCTNMRLTSATEPARSTRRQTAQLHGQAAACMPQSKDVGNAQPTSSSRSRNPGLRHEDPLFPTASRKARSKLDQQLPQQMHTSSSPHVPLDDEAGSLPSGSALHHGAIAQQHMSLDGDSRNAPSTAHAPGGSAEMHKATWQQDMNAQEQPSQEMAQAGHSSFAAGISSAGEHRRRKGKIKPVKHLHSATPAAQHTKSKPCKRARLHETPMNCQSMGHATSERHASYQPNHAGNIAALARGVGMSCPEATEDRALEVCRDAPLAQNADAEMHNGNGNKGDLRGGSDQPRKPLRVKLKLRSGDVAGPKSPEHSSRSDSKYHACRSAGQSSEDGADSKPAQMSSRRRSRDHEGGPPETGSLLLAKRSGSMHRRPYEGHPETLAEPHGAAPTARKPAGRRQSRDRKVHSDVQPELDGRAINTMKKSGLRSSRDQHGNAGSDKMPESSANRDLRPPIRRSSRRSSKDPPDPDHQMDAADLLDEGERDQDELSPEACHAQRHNSEPTSQQDAADEACLPSLETGGHAQDQPLGGKLENTRGKRRSRDAAGLPDGLAVEDILPGMQQGRRQTRGASQASDLQPTSPKKGAKRHQEQASAISTRVTRAAVQP
ncbi:hypothetical protein WJX74_004971 [Apatococcus lobatus]|uniref:Bromo domain-containing protein n=1 Tax=Apatococcus lobatus TaxID=904363 RepID=A0AAW1RC38_9CHLO